MLRSDEQTHENAVIAPVDDLITVQYDLFRSQNYAHRYYSVGTGDSTDDAIELSTIGEPPTAMQSSLAVPAARPRADTGNSRCTSGTFLTVDDVITHANEVRRASTSGEQSGLLVPSVSTTSSAMPSPGNLIRQPTMAQYERSLTLLGDDRRRPSAVKLQNLQDYQEAITPTRSTKPASISRPEIEDEVEEELDPLMTNALRRHQLGKALFQSASKRRESLLAARSSPASPNAMLLDVDRRSSSTNALPTEREDSLDLARDSFRRTSSKPYAASEIARPADLLNGGFSWQTDTGPKTSKQSVSVNPLSASPTISPTTAWIGTSLASWSRFASHTRSARCGSANIEDNVIARDFVGKSGEVRTNSAEFASPASKKSETTGDRKNSKFSSLIKRRSLTVGDVTKYYHNLLSTGVGFGGKNRRTSVTVGGKLKDPELEMVLPSMVVDSYSNSLHKHLRQIEDSIEEFKDTVTHLSPKHEHSHTSLFGNFGKQEGFAKSSSPAGSVFRVGSPFEEPTNHIRRNDTSIDLSSFGVQRMDTGFDISVYSGRRVDSSVDPSEMQQSNERDSPESPFQREDSVTPEEASGNDIPEFVISQIDGASACAREDPKYHPTSNGFKGALITSSPSSRAEVWSQMYKSCLTRHAPAFSSVSESANDNATAGFFPIFKSAGGDNPRSTSPLEILSTPMPTLKPLKARSPE
jgi:hypothetical protein